MLGLDLKRDESSGLAEQLYLQLKELILGGRLEGGRRLPSSRELAGELAVLRNTVITAYERLAAEGFIESRAGALSKITSGLALEPGEDRNRPQLGAVKPKSRIKVDFKTGQPDLKLFPKHLWGKIMRQAVTNLPPEYFGYRQRAGYQPLRREIAAWLQRQRGLKAAPEDIFICSGATAGLFLLTDLLYEGLPFAVENPSHPAIEAVLNLKGYPIRWAPVDENGLNISQFNPEGLSAVYVTPSHQFPLGGIMDAARRTALIRLARKHDFFIIEDDYDSEFRYQGPPIGPLYSLDPSRVIYVGTFSKTLYPALRIGFVILPQSLQMPWLRRRKFFDVQNPVLEQAALAEFLRLGKMERHVRLMRGHYAAKRKAVLDAVAESFGNRARVLGDAAGLHLTLEVAGANFDQKYLDHCQAEGVRISTLAAYCPGTLGHRDKLLLGYGHLSREDICYGVKVLAESLNS